MRLTGFALAVVALACGGSGPSRLSGTVGGKPVTVSYAVYAPPDPGQTDTGSMLIFSSSSDPCGDFRNRMYDSGSEQLSIVIANRVGAGNAINDVRPGAYVSGDSGLSVDSASLVVHDGCYGKIAEMTEGTVELDSIATDARTPAKGTLHLAFGDDAVTGTFEAPVCGTNFVRAYSLCR